MSTFSVRGVLSLDGSQFAGALGQASRSVDRFKSSIGSAATSRIAGLFSLGAAEEGIRRTIEFAGHIQDLSDRLGVSVEWLQEMQYVMKQNGGTADDLAKVLEKIQTNRRAALSGTAGSGAVLEQFGKLGLSGESLSGAKSGGSEAIVAAIAAKFKAGGQTDELSAAFRKVGGKAAANLIASFRDGIEDGRKQARDAGAVMTEDVVAQLDDIGDQFATMWQEIMVTIGPAIIEIVNLVRDMFLAFRRDALAAYGFISQLDLGKIFKALFTGGLTGASAEAGKQFALAKDQAGYNFEQQSDADKEAEINRNQQLQDRRNARNKVKKGEDVPFQQYKPKESFKIESDALTSVGNFLGSNTQSTLARLAQRQTDLLQSIDRNIERLASDVDTDGFSRS